MGFKERESKPTGFIGKIIDRLINNIHTAICVDYFNNNIIPDNFIHQNKTTFIRLKKRGLNKGKISIYKFDNSVYSRTEYLKCR